MKIKAKTHLAEALRELSKVPKETDGRIGWESSALEHGTFEVIYNLAFEPEIEDYDKDGAVWHALNECARAKDFSVSFFTRKLRAFLNEQFSKKPRSFIAVMQLNAQIGARLPTRLQSVDGPTEICTTLPRFCQAVIDKLDRYERDRLDLHDSYAFMIVRVKSRNERVALDAAYRRIKFALGLMNLASGGFGVSARIGYPNAPMGKFLSLSPIFLIDTAARKVGNWQSSTHFLERWKRSFTVSTEQRSAGDMVKFAKEVVSELPRIDFRERLVQSVVLFQEALEAAQVDAALLKIWTAIEVLCAKEEHEATSKIIDRASGLFQEQDHVRMRLNYIQAFRNKIVHRGEGGDHALLCAQHGSNFLARLIGFCLWNAMKYRKRELILDFLSLPHDEEKLELTIALHRKRLAGLKRARARAAAAGSP